MGVHRNTMAYRIKKIIDLFGRDLYDILTICRLLTSFRIMEFTRGRDFIDRL
jgi:DNA-binding PucR family transcriptional regulator